MSYTQHDNQTLLKLAPFTGVWGISFLVLVFNTFVAAALDARPDSKEDGLFDRKAETAVRTPL